MSRMRPDKNNKLVAKKLKQAAKNSAIAVSLEKSTSVREALLTALSDNQKLVVLASALATHALPDPSNQLAALTREVATTYPARFFGLGELLEDLVSTAHELLNQGLRPLVLMGSTDLARSYAGFSALCAARSPVIFLLAAGPEEGQTWQSQGANDLAILRTLPTLAIGVPSGPAELKRHLAVALQNEEGPMALHYIPAEQPLPNKRATLAPSAGVGKALMLHEGKDLAIVALGAAVGPALALSEALMKAGYDAAVVDACWLRPLDEALLSAVANYFPRLVTLETGSLTAGFGAALLEMLEISGLHPVRVKRFSLQDPTRLDPAVLLDYLSSEIGRFMEKARQEEGFPGSSFFQAHPSEA